MKNVFLIQMKSQELRVAKPEQVTRENFKSVEAKYNLSLEPVFLAL